VLFTRWCPSEQPPEGALRLVQFLPDAESAELENWEFMDHLWVGEALDRAGIAVFRDIMFLGDDKFGASAWKSHDWDALNRLHEKGYIGNPVSKNKSVALTEEGKAKAEELFRKLFGKPK
jgi:hypothetical protein